MQKWVAQWVAHCDKQKGFGESFAFLKVTISENTAIHLAIATAATSYRIENPPKSRRIWSKTGKK